MQLFKFTLPPTFPPGMRRRSDVPIKSHIGWDVADHAAPSSQRRSKYVNETDIFEISLRRVIGTQKITDQFETS